MSNLMLPKFSEDYYSISLLQIILAKGINAGIEEVYAVGTYSVKNQNDWESSKHLLF